MTSPAGVRSVRDLPIIPHPQTREPLRCTRIDGEGYAACSGYLRKYDSPSQDNGICPDCNNQYAISGLIVWLSEHEYPTAKFSDGAPVPALVMGEGYVEVNGVRYYAGGQAEPDLGEPEIVTSGELPLYDPNEQYLPGDEAPKPRRR